MPNTLKRKVIPKVLFWIVNTLSVLIILLSVVSVTEIYAEEPPKTDRIISEDSEKRSKKTDVDLDKILQDYDNLPTEERKIFDNNFDELMKARKNNEFREAQKAYESKNYKKSYELFTRLAENNNLTANVFLSRMHIMGQGVEKNIDRGLYLLIKAEGSKLAVSYLHKLYNESLELARKGDAPSMYLLGKMCLWHLCGKEGFKDGIVWLLKSAEAGYALAQFDMGVKYLQGKGVPKNSSEALKWLRQSANNGYTNAQFNLGMLYLIGRDVEKNRDEGIKLIRIAAENGHAKAQYFLGDMYYRGSENLTKDPIKAFKWVQKAAEQGDANAQWILAAMYGMGNGIKKDSSKSLEMMIKSADGGYPQAQYTVGVLYIKGRRVRKDIFQGLNYLKMAADNGYVNAQYDLGVLYLSGKEGVEKNIENGVKWMNKSADNGHAKALHTMSILYAKGLGVPRNYIQAYAYCAAATKLNVQDAKKDLSTIQKKMTPEQVAEGKKQAEILLAKKKGEK